MAHQQTHSSRIEGADANYFTSTASVASVTSNKSKRKNSDGFDPAAQKTKRVHIKGRDPPADPGDDGPVSASSPSGSELPTAVSSPTFSQAVLTDSIGETLARDRDQAASPVLRSRDTAPARLRGNYAQHAQHARAAAGDRNNNPMHASHSTTFMAASQSLSTAHVAPSATVGTHLPTAMDTTEDTADVPAASTPRHLAAQPQLPRMQQSSPGPAASHGFAFAAGPGVTGTTPPADAKPSLLPKDKISGRVNPPGTTGPRPKKPPITAGGPSPAPASARAAHVPAPAPTPAPAPAPVPSMQVPYQIPPQPLRPFRNPLYPEIDLEPRTRTITPGQLVNEVKGIYVGLAMVESKCIEIDNEQNANKDRDGGRLEPEQWQALMALHRTLLHEHHDFMLASHHPSASPALRRVALKYAMPARMWRHGIHSFLELLRHRLPASREHMITFIYTAYSIMALLYESVDAFHDTWVECLGDLSRYRMAIEDDNQRLRETWTGVSRRWYALASDSSPGIGRLYHHLAILSRPSIVAQMFYYTKSLCVIMPFMSTHDSIRTLLDPVLRGLTQRAPPTDVDYTKAHGLLFLLTSTTETQRAAPYQQPLPASKLQEQPQEQPQPQQEQESAEQQQQLLQQQKAQYKQYERDLPAAVERFLAGLDSHLEGVTNEWIQKGAHMAAVNCCSLMGYGRKDNELYNVFNNALAQPEVPPDVNGEDELSKYSGFFVDSSNSNNSSKPAARDLGPAQDFVTRMDRIVFARAKSSRYCNGYIQARLVWMLSLARASCEGMLSVERAFPWDELIGALNQMLLTCISYDTIEQPTVMKPNTGGPSAAEQEAMLAQIAAKKEQEVRKQAEIYGAQLLRKTEDKTDDKVKAAEDKDKTKGSKAKHQLAVELATTASSSSSSSSSSPPPAPAPPLLPLLPATASYSAPASAGPATTATTTASASRGDDETKPIPDDWALRGLIWTEGFYPAGWFASASDSVDGDEKLMETGSVALARQTRILWMGCRLAAYQRWIYYDSTHHYFSVAPAFASPAKTAKPASTNKGKPASKGKDVAMEDAPPAFSKVSEAAPATVESTDSPATMDYDEEAVPGLLDDSQSDAASEQHDGADVDGDDNVSVTHEHQVAVNRMARFNQEHGSSAAAAVPAPVPVPVPAASSSVPAAPEEGQSGSLPSSSLISSDKRASQETAHGTAMSQM